MTTTTTRGAAWPVQVVEPYPDCPQLVFGRCAARSARFGRNAAAGGDPVIIGSAAGPNAESVVPRARGELTERVGNILAGRRAETDPHVTGTFDELRRRGTPAVDPAVMTDGTPALRSAPMLWVRGRSLVGEGEMLVPAGAVYLHHRPPPGCTAPLRTGSTGLAAHRTHEAAVRHAALEIVERGLLVDSWYGREARLSPGHDLRPSAGLSEVLAALELRLRSWVITGPGTLACVLVCVHRPDGTGQAFGARCASTRDGLVPRTAVDIAGYEALMVRWSMTTRAADQARRALRGAGSTGPRTAVEHAVHAFDHPYALAYLDTRPACRAAGSEVDAAAAAEPDLVDVLSRATGGDVIAVDTTVPGLADPDAVVVRLVVPGARRLPGAEPGGRDGTPPHPIG